MAGPKTPKQRTRVARAQLPRRTTQADPRGEVSAQPGWRPAKYKVRKRASRFLNFLPPKSHYCVAPAGSTEYNFRPLVCHASFMDALHDQDIPDHQGFTTKSNSPRNITCEGTRITDTERAPYSRSDNLPIFEIRRCNNQTVKNVWLGGQYQDVREDDLAQFDREEGRKWMTLLLPIGALFGLMALQRR